MQGRHSARFVPARTACCRIQTQRQISKCCLNIPPRCALGSLYRQIVGILRHRQNAEEAALLFFKKFDSQSLTYQCSENQGSFKGTSNLRTRSSLEFPCFCQAKRRGSLDLCNRPKRSSANPRTLNKTAEGLFRSSRHKTLTSREQVSPRNGPKEGFCSSQSCNG